MSELENAAYPDSGVSPQAPVDPDLDSLATSMARAVMSSPDPAAKAAQMHVAAEEARGRTVPAQQQAAMVQAYAELFGGGSQTAAGGDAALQQTLYQQSKSNSGVGNLLRGFGESLAEKGAKYSVAVSGPEAAVQQQRQASYEYNPDPDSWMTWAGKQAGTLVGMVPNVLIPGAAIPSFAYEGAAGAIQQDTAAKMGGQQISAPQMAAHAILEGGIQAAVGHFLGDMGAGGMASTEGGELTQVVPFQNLLRSLSPESLKVLQGTDGAVIKPIVERVLLRMGQGSLVNESAVIASEIARTITGTVGTNEPDLGQRIVQQTPAALAGGAIQALPFALHGELGAAGAMNRGPVEEVPQENIQDMGKQGAVVRQVRNAVEEYNPSEEAAPAAEAPAPAAEAPVPQAPTEEGRQMPPVEQRLAENPQFTNQTAELQRQAAESDELLNRVRTGEQGEGAPPAGNGALPNETDLETGLPKGDFISPEEAKYEAQKAAYVPAKELADPLVEGLRAFDPQVKQVSVPEYTEDFSALQDHGITPVAVDGKNIPAGFSLPNHPDAVAFDVNDPEGSFRTVLAHEAAHVWQDLNPAKADQLYRMIPAELRTKYADDYYTRLLNSLASGGASRDEAVTQAQEYMAKNKKQEVISTAFGDAATNDSMVGRAWQKSEGLWNTVKDAFSRVVNTFSGKGRMLNQIAEAMRQGLGLPQGETAAGGGEEGRQTPQSYLNIGHKFNRANREPGSEELWWKTPEGEIVTKPVTAASPTHAGAMDLDNPFRGRIDHTAKEISVAGTVEAGHTEPDAMQQKRLIATASEMQKKYPGYDVYVAGKGGVVPLEELTSGGRFMLSKLSNIAHTKEDAAAYKEELNENSPRNEIAFETTKEDMVKRQVFDSQAPVVSMIRTAMSRVNDPTKLSPEAFLRRMGGFRERRFQQEKLGLRSLDGEEIVDPKSGENITRQWLVKPVMDYAAKSGEKAEDVLANANSAMVAQRTLEKGESAVRAETYRTMREKIRSIIGSLPAGRAGVKKPAVMAEGEEEAGPTEDAKIEHRKTLALIKTAQQHLADLRSFDAEQVPEPDGEGEAGKPKPKGPSDAAIEKAQGKLQALQALIDQAKNGKKLEPSDVLSETELNTARDRALAKPISGIGGLTGHADIAEAERFLGEHAGEDSAAAAAEYARRVRIWGNEHVKMAVDSGLISKDAATAMLNDNKFYVNMQRVMEDHGILGEGDFADGKYHRFRGSNRMIDNPLANTLQSTEQIARKAEENFVKQKIVALTKPFGDMIQPAAKEGPDTIKVLEDGEPVYYHTDPQVANVIQGWGKNTPPALWGALSLPGRLKAFGTLLRPMFRWNHFRKQFQNRLLISEEAGGLKGLAATAGGFDADTKQLLDVLGGTMGHERDYGSTSGEYHDLISKMLGKLGGDKNALLALPRAIWNGYQKLGEWSDAFNRVVEYKQGYANAKRRGMDELNAQAYGAWKARDLMDFSVGGEIMKQVNRICYQPFLNAEMQGLRKVYDLARSNPTLAAQRLALFGLLPSMIPYLWAKSQGKDVEKNYVDTPLAQRIMFYQFQVGNYRLMVPKGQTQAMAGALWEAFADKHRGDVGTWARAMGQSGLIPRPLTDPESLLPFSGVRESISNYSWFYDKHIVPPDQEGLALDLRHTDGSSGVSQQISKLAKTAGWEVDPRKIDHVLATDLGTSGQDVESLSNLGSAKKPLASMALASYTDMRLPPGYTSVSVQDAMKTASYYKDTSSPQYKQVQEALGESYKATTVEERNHLVDQARAAADAANQFYQDHGQELIAAKNAASAITAAIQEGKDEREKGNAAQWAKENPDKVALLNQGPRLDVLQKRLSELRNALVNPRLSDSTKQMANRDISRLYGVIVKMVSDTTQNQ